MALFELTANGVQRATLAEIISSMESSAKAQFGDTFDTSDTSVAGIFIRLVADVADQCAEFAESVYNANDPETAVGVSLDRDCSLVGVTRLPATNSLVSAKLTGDFNTAIPSGSIVEVDGTQARFVSQNAITLDLSSAIFGTAEVTSVLNSTQYDVIINGITFSYISSGSATAEEIAAGLVASIQGGSEPVTASDNLDGTFSVTANDESVSFTMTLDAGLTPRKVSKLNTFESESTGPIQAPAGTLTQIVTPILGWDSATNSLDATLGRDLETDTDLRVRRRASLAIAGATTLPAIQSALLALDSVEAVVVIENDTTVTDGDGRPAKSFESIVLGGSDADIARVIWEDKPIGIETHGSESVVHIDELGSPRLINFSRPTEIYTHIRVSYTLNPEESFPSTGESAILESVLETGQALSIGDDVIPSRFFGPIYRSVTGIGELTVEVATSAGPLDPPGAYQETTLTINSTEISSFDSSRIVIQQV